MLSDLVFRLRSLFRRNTVEAELDDELRFHFEQQVEKCIRSELTAVIPASLFANLQPTAGGIQVFNPDGGHSGEAGFYFNALPPQIASISPSSTAANSPGFTLTVTGSNFNTSSWVLE
jgi:IPT/TIG domain